MNLRLNKKYSDDELVTKFNMISQTTDNNSETIHKIYKKIDNMENTIINKIDNSNNQINDRISKIEVKDKIDDVKTKSSFSNKLNIAGDNVLTKIIEFAILSVLIYAVTHMK